ncbi:MAG: hypothetical protein R3351_01515 [Nitrospirales bacterium]|nr:hypothetical protein [Nitrospirales bacterium]
MKLPKSSCVMVSLILGIFLVPDVLHANKAHQILSHKSNQARNEALTVLFIQTEEDCNFVVKNFFQGLEPEGGALWNVTCGNGNSYVILIENDDRGSTRIMNCALIKSLTKGKSTCFKKLN